MTIIKLLQQYEMLTLFCNIYTVRTNEIAIYNNLLYA